MSRISSDKVLSLGESRFAREASPSLRAAEIGLAIIAAGAVLNFGGVLLTTHALMELGAALLTLFVFWRGEWPRLSRGTLAVLCTAVTLPLLQCLPLPRALVGLVSPVRTALEEKLLSPFHVPLGLTPLSVNPHATLIAFLKITCYAMAFLLGYQIHRHRGRSRLLIPALVSIGLFEAVYGMIQYLTGWQYIFTYPKQFNTNVGTGTYINPNHYAGLLAMVLPFVLALILFRFPARELGGRGKWKRIVALQLPGPWMAQVLLFTVILLGLVFSQSRMGLIAAIAGILVVATIGSLQAGRRTGLTIFVLVLGLPLAYAAWIGLSPVVDRFENLASPEYLREELRGKMWRETIHLIRDFPVLGTGLGTYRWAIAPYQSETVLYTLDYAHNDYLQLASEIGIPAALLIFGGLWTLVVQVARRAGTIEPTRDKILAVGCAGALVPLLVHALVEFNFQIPANAFVYAWIAGTAAALCRGARSADGQGDREARFWSESPFAGRGKV